MKNGGRTGAGIGNTLGATDRSRLMGGGVSGETLTGLLEIVGSVDADVVEKSESCLDAEAVLKPAQLFEGFSDLEGGAGKSDDAGKGSGAIAVHPDVSEIGSLVEPFLPGIGTDVGDNGAREIKGTAIKTGDDLHKIGIEKGLEATGRIEWADESSDIDRGIVETAHEIADLLRLDKGFVALDIDDHRGIGAAETVCLINAVGSTGMIGRCHDNFAAERTDTLKNAVVVGSDDHTRERHRSLTVDTLDHSETADIGKGFARETGRGVAGGYNTYN